MEMKQLPAHRMTKPISPGQHAVLDYGLAASFIGLGLSKLGQHRRAGILALINGGMVLGVTMLTDFPGGIFKVLSLKTHRTADICQAAFSAAGPILFGFARDREARWFYRQAVSEGGVIAATDWDAGTGSRRLRVASR